MNKCKNIDNYKLKRAEPETFFRRKQSASPLCFPPRDFNNGNNSLHLSQ